MASILNTANCGTSVGNTGLDSCAFDPKLLKGGFLVPNSFVLTATQLQSSASVLAALTAAVNNDNPALRIYPLPETVALTDSSEAPVIDTLGYGVPVTVRDGNYSFSQQFIKGGLCLLKQLRNFNGSNWRWIGLDSAGNLICTRVGDTAVGVPLYEFYADPFKFSDSKTVTQYIYRLTFNPVYINDNIAFIPMSYSDIVGLLGIQNINITVITPRVAGVFTVKLTSGCSSTDLYPIYGADLAAAANFRVTENGKVITITSVAEDPNTNGFVVTLDVTDPDYTAGGPFLVNLAPISVLTAAGVIGYEGVAKSIA